MDGSADFVIVGGGVTGLSAAWWLAREGYRVCVVERDTIGYGPSGRNGGGCSHHHSPLFLEEQRLWPMLADMLGRPTEFRPGRLRIAMNERQLALYAQAMRNGARHGYATDVLAPEDVARHVPLSDGACVGGFHYRFGGHANPHRVVHAFAWSIMEHGGTILQQTEAMGFDTDGARVSAVRTKKGRITCGAAILAPGVALSKLARLLEIDVPLAAARAELIVTEPLPAMPHSGVDGNGLYGRQTLRGNLVYGGGPHEWLETEGAEHQKPLSTPLAALIGARLVQMFPRAAHASIIRSWGGIIENTPDGRPIIDRAPFWENVVIATMSSVGFGLSPASGRAIRDLALEGRCSFADISSLRLDRFSALSPEWRAERGWTPLPLAPA